MLRLSHYITKNFISKEYKKFNSTNLDQKYYSKWILYNYLTQLKYVVKLKNIKTSTLEWTLPSPVPAHTFVVAPKVITVSKKFKKYRKNYFLKTKQFNLPISAGIDKYFDLYIEVFYSSTRKNREINL
jgi:heme/copper-type cytochrome/quinol oxidase subunit 1